MALFDRDKVKTFRFVHSSFDAQTGEVRLAYAFDNGLTLIEKIGIPGAPFTLDAALDGAVRRMVRLLHLIAGVSYYKAAPAAIQIEQEPIDSETATLLESIYRNGLAEFAYKNALDMHDRIRFPRVAEPVADAPVLGLQERALTAIGGGKDSLVSIEALRSAAMPQTVTWVGGSQLIHACAVRTELPRLQIKRALAPELFEINRQGAYNGHIPVTAINSAILALTALLHGAAHVVFSNERSASFGTLVSDTGEVNHQWSKGWAFETQFAAYVQRYIAQDLRYYSLLRPLSEIAVARQFAKSDRYDAYFSSCNRNFHILGEKPTQRWCGMCPKCHFVFLALAPFMAKTRLVGIFGKNLLDDPAQARGYDALMEYRELKPFECVGEGRESRAAMALLAQRPEWRDDALIARFAAEIQPRLNPDDLALESFLRFAEEQRIPVPLWERVRAHFSA